MKKFLILAIISLLAINNSNAQNTNFDNYVKEGIRLYDSGDFTGAIEQYKKALAIDSNSAVANYEIASTYFSLKEYQKAVDFSDKVIKQKGLNGQEAFILKGSALDILGNPAEAINVYKIGQLVYPESYLLYFNLALTLFNNKGDIKEIEDNLLLALKIKPTHPTSHLLLAYLMVNQGKRVQALLALYNFLLVEPKGNRGAQALNLLDAQLKKGVKSDNEKSTTITLTMGDKDDEFSAAELMISLLAASKNLEENKNKTGTELFAANTKSLFTVLGELKKKDGDFWWSFYVDFFYAMEKNNMVEPFCYYIRQSAGDDAVNTWLTNNTAKTDELLTWIKGYERKVK